jgi:RNA polymerase sigma-70 factor (ECF subfamily)
MSAGEAEAEELAQSVWAELYGLRTRADGTPSGKLAYYSGCGSLGGWLRAVVGQLGVDSHRRTSRLVQTEEAADFDRMANEEHQGEDGFRVAAAPDPERAFAETEAAQAVHVALACAVSELDAEDRLLVKLYYFDDLRLREAGAVLGVHEATASRRLARAQTEIRRRVEALLVAEHGWTRDDVSRTLRDVGVHLQSDLQRLLTASSAETVVEEQRE